MGMLKNTLKFASGTILSRLLGMIRDILMASYYGSGVIAEAFFIAFRIPNLFRDMLAEGALSQAFTKTYSQQDSHAATNFLSKILAHLLVSGVVLSILGYFFAPLMVDWMTSFAGDSPAKLTMIAYAKKTSQLLFIMLPLMMIASVLMGALTKQGNFFIASLGSVFFNIGFIAGIVVIGPLFYRYIPDSFGFTAQVKTLLGLSCGVLGGCLLNVIIFAWSMRQKISLAKMRPVWTPEIKATLLLMLPAAFAASAGPINHVVNTNFATSLELGSVSWLSYAFRLFHLPVGVFAVALSMAILPKVSVLVQKAPEQFIKHYEKAIVACVWIMGWMTVCTWFCAKDLVTLVFGRGSFSFVDIIMTASALRFYAIGLIGYGLVKVLVTYYFAKERTSTPFKIALLCVGINLGLNYYLVDYFQHSGMALTASIVLSINFILLLAGIMGDYPELFARIARHVGSGLLMIFLAFLTGHFLSYFWVFPDSLPSMMESITRVMLFSLACTIVFILSLIHI